MSTSSTSEAKSPAAHPRVRPLQFLVVGSPRSGTTLVQRLAMELDGVSMPPETHLLAELGLALAALSWPLDQQAAGQVVDSFAELPTSQGLRLDRTQLRDALVGRTSALGALDLLADHLAGPGTLLGEKTPDHLRWWRAISRARPSMRFVVVVRDPRAVVASNLRAPFRAEAMSRWPGTYHLALSVHWLHTQQLALELLRQRPQQTLLLRYEDVLANGDRSRRDLAAFLGRPVVPRVGDAAGDQPAASPVVLEWETWKRDAFAPIDRSRAGRWTEDLAPAAAAQVFRLCRATMADFGYVGGRPARTAIRLDRSVRQRLRGLAAGLREEQRRIDDAEL